MGEKIGQAGEAGPECAVIIGHLSGATVRAAGVAWPSALLPGTTRQPTRGGSDAAFSYLKDNCGGNGCAHMGVSGGMESVCGI